MIDNSVEVYEMGTKGVGRSSFGDEYDGGSDDDNDGALVTLN